MPISWILPIAHALNQSQSSLLSTLNVAAGMRSYNVAAGMRSKPFRALASRLCDAILTMKKHSMLSSMQPQPWSWTF